MPARFRPCIDLHQGQVKQIVGSTLSDEPGKGPVTNFVASRPSSAFAEMYMRDALPGGHVIMLGPGNEEAAKSALRAYPGGLQVGGGITPANAASYLEAGASHVIVTSYVFRDGRLDDERLAEIVSAVGKERLVLDLSCRRKEPGGPFFVVTDRWQKFTSLELSAATLSALAQHCSEFLVHAVDVEGKQSGIEQELVSLLGQWSPIPLTYAGGARSIAVRAPHPRSTHRRSARRTAPLSTSCTAPPGRHPARAGPGAGERARRRARRPRDRLGTRLLRREAPLRRGGGVGPAAQAGGGGGG